jgi:hypothetical protein
LAGDVVEEHEEGWKEARVAGMSRRKEARSPPKVQKAVQSPLEVQMAARSPPEVQIAARSPPKVQMAVREVAGTRRQVARSP